MVGVSTINRTLVSGSARTKLQTTRGAEIARRTATPALPVACSRRSALASPKSSQDARIACCSNPVSRSDVVESVRKSRRGGAVVASAVSPPLSQDTVSKGDEMAEAYTIPVVTVEWLRQHINNSDVKILDASWYMPAEKRNPLQEYKESHIPGALFFDVDGISDVTAETPHMLPSEEVFSAAISALGIENHHRVVVYDGSGIFSAPRVWWMFRAFGHQKIWVLNGGFPKWRENEYPLESGVSPETLEKISAAGEVVKEIYGGKKVEPGRFTAHLKPHLVWSLDQVLQNIETKKHMLVDARGKPRFDGAVAEPRKGVRSGHVPGSACVPFPKVLTKEGTLLPEEEIIREFESAGVSVDSPIVVSCGSGLTACILAMALFRLGIDDVAVYDGSWTEWGLASNTPVEKTV